LAEDSSPPPENKVPVDDDGVREVLSAGEIVVRGRLTDASNVTLLGDVSLDGVSMPCIYKPVRGERPLWDFPDGTLAARELAAYRVSAVSGLDCVPVTVLRAGPFGMGMVQRWIDDVDPTEMVDLVPVDRVPPGWLPVLRAVDEDGADVAAVHADDQALARLAGFDLIVNNADRKGSHVLPVADGRVLGVDHGLCFHVDDKLRTILWGWAGKPLPDGVVDSIARLASALEGSFARELSDLLTTAEITALVGRLADLDDRRVFPKAPMHRTPIPWPPL
jgi:uncharacterized repeat protein (TIGR03843 family)